MAETSSLAIVAIVVVVVLAMLGVGYAFRDVIFESQSTTIVENKNPVHIINNTVVRETIREEKDESQIIINGQSQMNATVQ